MIPKRLSKEAGLLSENHRFSNDSLSLDMGLMGSRYVYPRSALGIPCKLEVAACLTVPVPGLGVEVSAT